MLNCQMLSDNETVIDCLISLGIVGKQMFVIVVWNLLECPYENFKCLNLLKSIFVFKM